MHTDKLHKLIHSMSSAEKRHFQQSIRGGKDTKSVQLYLAILKQKEYKEAPLVKKFDYTENPNGFAVAKNHLYKLVLKSLRDFSPVSSDYQKILVHCRNIELLERRGLPNEALKSMQKVYDIAEVNQWGVFLLIAEKCKYRLTAIKELPKLPELNIGYHLDIELQYENLYRRISYHNLIYGFNQQQNEKHCYKEVLTHDLMQSIEKAPNFFCRWYFCRIKIELCRSESQAQKHLAWAEKLVNIRDEMNTQGYLIEDWRTTSYFEYLSALIDNRDLSKYHSEYPKILDFEIPASRLNFLHQRNRDTLLLRLRAFIYGKYSRESFDELILVAESYMEDNKDGKLHINDVYLITVVSYLYYSSGDFNKLLEWQVLYSQKIDRDLYVDYHIFNQVIVILSHQMLYNFEHIESLLPALERHMEKHNRLVPIYVFLIRCIKKMQSPLSKKERHALLRDFKSDMKVLIKGGTRNYFLQPEGLLIWADSQIANLTLFEMNIAIFEEGKKKWL